jgi:hypothetical protein
MRSPILAMCWLISPLVAMPVLADELRPEQLFPETTMAFVSFDDPAAALSIVMEHPLRQKIEALDAWKQATEQQQYRNFLTGRKMFEIQMGREWRDAVEALTGQGIAVGFDPATGGVAAVIHGEDAEVMETFRAKLLEMLRLNEGLKIGDYEGVTTYQLDQNNSGAAVVEDWLIVTNKGDLGKHIIDRILDKSSDTKSLASNPQFQMAVRERSRDAAIWGFADLNILRQQPNIEQALEQQSNNPGVELILGGIQSALRQTPWISAEFALNPDRTRLAFKTPLQSDWIPEERQWFFGPDNGGKAPELPEVPQTLMTLAAYRDISEMWLRAGDLFDANMNDQLAEADSNLTTLFAGRDFGEDILGSFRPEVGFLAARQSFEGVIPAPAIRLPSFALILQMKEPETMTRELRRTFQSMIGFFNVVGAMEGRPQLEMDMEQVGDAQLVTSFYIPEEDERDSDKAGILFNFSPSVGFVDDYCVISSTAGLARTLTTEDHAVQQHNANTLLNIDASVLQTVLQDNREQLVSQNMLEDGNTREEAETQIDLLLQLVGYFKSGGLSLSTTDQKLELQFNLQVNTDSTREP